jgi:ribonuclease BN (tRNA processing enzyme)
MARALVLGSGAALSAKGRFNTTLAVLEGPRTILLDCAQPCTELLYHHGVDAASVDTVVLAHMHADHVTGLGQVAHMKHLLFDPKPPRIYLDRLDPWYKDQLRHPPKDQWDRVKESLTVYVPGGVELAIEEYLRALYMRREVFTKFALRVVPYGIGEIHKDETFTITAYANAHIRSYYPELRGTDAMVDSYSLVVEVGGKKCLYSSDIASLSEIERLAKQVDVVFVEGAHPTPKDIVDFAKRLDLKRVFVKHIHAPHEEGFANMKAEMARANVTLSYDGLEIEL